MKEQSAAYRFTRPLINLHLGDPSASLLLMFLCHAANNKTGESWHSLASIGYTTGMSEKTIRRAAKALMQLGVISCQMRGHYNSKSYSVNHAKLLELAEAGQAGRRAYIDTEQDKKAARQQRWRNAKNGVSPDESETPKTALVGAKRGIAETPKTVLARHQNGRPNYVSEPVKRTEERELEESHLSGTQELNSRKVAEFTPESIQELEQEVLILKSLKDNAMAERRPKEYERLTRELRESQARLNIARGQLCKLAKAAAA